MGTFNSLEILREEVSRVLEDCYKEVLKKYPMLAYNAERVTDWTINEPWGSVFHQIAVAETVIASFEVGCEATDNPTMYSVYRKGPVFLATAEEVKMILRRL